MPALLASLELRRSGPARQAWSVMFLQISIGMPLAKDQTSYIWYLISIDWRLTSLAAQSVSCDGEAGDLRFKMWWKILNLNSLNLQSKIITFWCQKSDSLPRFFGVWCPPCSPRWSYVEAGRRGRFDLWCVLQISIGMPLAKDQTSYISHLTSHI